MWQLWQTRLGNKRREFTDEDWLNSACFFYNEERRLVRVRVQDCLDSNCLGYDYEDVPIERGPEARELAKKRRALSLRSSQLRPQIRVDHFPLKLEGPKRVWIKRPNKLRRTKLEKEEEEEVLLFSGIRFNLDVAVSFDIYVNDFYDECEPNQIEYVGSFVNVPHVSQSNMTQVSCLRLGLTDTMEDGDFEGDDCVLVTLNPTYDWTKALVTIKEGHIEFAS